MILTEGGAVPMTTVQCWTGRETKLLRGALRLSIRAFAAQLGVGTRTVNKWEARQASITLLPYMQQVLDTALARSSDEVKARFAAAVDGSQRGIDAAVPPDTTGLWVAPVRFGFGAAGATVGEAGVDSRKLVSWVDRRDFAQHVAAVAVGVTGVAGLDVDRLIALLPQADPTGTRHIGVADVETIEQATVAFVRQDFAHGSGLYWDAAVGRLRATLPLLDAQASPEVRSRLYIAVADLAKQAGWMSFDAEQHDAARRLWMIALDVARAAEDPRGSDLTVFVLYDLALQAVALNRPDEALRLVHLGHAAATGSPPVSPATASCLANIQARAHAARGEAAACDRALGQAVEHFAAIDPANREPWVAFHDDISLSAYQGVAQYRLALANGDPGAAGRAVPLLRHAVDGFSSDYARSRGRNLPHLAGAHAIAGDVGTAVSLGHQAVDAVTALHSPRAYDGLRVLSTALEPLHTSVGVAELRDRLRATAA